MAECSYGKLIAKANECFENKDYAKALKLYDRAVKLKPSDDSFAANHAKSQKKMKRKMKKKKAN